MKKHNLTQTLRQIVRPIVRELTHRHDPLLINSLAAFNFRPPLNLQFPGDQRSSSRLTPTVGYTYFC